MLSLTMSLKGQLPTTTDSVVRLKPSVARAMFRDALQRPILEEKISILNTRIATKDSVITLLQSAANKDEGAIMELQSQKKDLQDEVNLLKTAVVDLNKVIRREKRKRFITGALGAAATAGALILHFSK